MTAPAGPPLIGVLSNPASGGNRKHLPAIRKLLAGRDQISHREAATLPAINAALDDLLQPQPAYLVINGGDGTIQAVLTRLLTGTGDPPPPLVILKAGTTSMTAGDVGLRGPAPRALEDFLARAAAGTGLTFTSREILRLDPPGRPPLCGMFFGAGCIPQGIRYFHEKVNRRGLRGEIGPALVVARFLFALAGGGRRQICRPPTLTWTIDGRETAGWPCLLLMATTLKRLFFGWHPFWDHGQFPVHFTAVREHPHRFFRLLPSLVRGRASRLATPANGYLSRNAVKITLTGIDQFTLDGQLYELAAPDDRVTISSGGRLRFVQSSTDKSRPPAISNLDTAAGQPPTAGETNDRRRRLARLTAFISRHPDASSPVTAAMAAALRQRYGPALLAILFYGSCRRQADHFDGLLDFYLIVDRYRHAYGRFLPAAANCLLPPNVFYLETRVAGRPARAKYAVLSLADLQRGTSRWSHPYLWGRFAQPVSLLYSRSPAVSRQIDAALARAVLTLVTATLPCLPPTFTPAALWSTGLELSYATELRPERPGQGKRLYQADRDYYDRLTALALPAVIFPTAADPRQPGSYQARIPAGYRRRAKRQWRLRRLQGKTFHILRLLKAFFTFQGGFDYLGWKIERHAGVSMAPPPGRRHNLLTFTRALWHGRRRGTRR